MYMYCIVWTGSSSSSDQHQFKRLDNNYHTAYLFVFFKCIYHTIVENRKFFKTYLLDDIGTLRKSWYEKIKIQIFTYTHTLYVWTKRLFLWIHPHLASVLCMYLCCALVSSGFIETVCTFLYFVSYFTKSQCPLVLCFVQ